MKAVRFVIPKTSSTSFRLQEDRAPYFYETIHYHPEYQLTLIIKGEGTRFIGNSVERFKPGDIFLIGKNVPHVFRSDDKYYNANRSLESYSISIFLNDDTFGKLFFELPEMASIKRLLNKALYGISFNKEDNTVIKKMIKDVSTYEDFDRFQHILKMFNYISKIHNVQLLSPVPFMEPSSEQESERINVVFQYLSKHFTSEIQLDCIAHVASMTPNSFCRYFKKRTGKSFSHFLNDMRIEYACHLMANTQDNFGRISADCGYNSLSYFNRQFKLVMGQTPTEYRNKYSLYQTEG
ncbi:MULTISPECIES: AraC family transcriptional regulator [unclassified Saccharicrinis]|uniref:AraC family transcriptional regulator n=1 Tax=unclassified Saccharicrinis TaxID=2646859 RepID=UPI003D355E1C